MGLARLEREPQRLARPQQVDLAREFLERARAQPVCERRLRFLPGEQGIGPGLIH
jgi:hypothetical protein